MYPKKCPACGHSNVWRYGWRREREAKFRRYRCNACGHVWESGYIEMWSIPSKLVSPFLRLLRILIDDAEKGINPDEMGWVTIDTETAQELLQTNLCEWNDVRKKIRVKPSCELPDDLAKTDEGIMFRVIPHALKLDDEIRKSWRDEKIRLVAVLAGLTRMVEYANFEVSVEVLISENMYKTGWFSVVRRSAHQLAARAVEELWGKESAKLAINAFRAQRGLDPDGVDEKILEKIERMLRWRDVIKYFDKATLEVLGFMWYVDFLTEKTNIGTPEGEQIVNRSAKTVLGNIGKATENISRILKELEKKPEGMEVNWNGVFCFPG